MRMGRRRSTRTAARQDHLPARIVRTKKKARCQKSAEGPHPTNPKYAWYCIMNIRQAFDTIFVIPTAEETTAGEETTAAQGAGEETTAPAQSEAGGETAGPHPTNPKSAWYCIMNIRQVFWLKRHRLASSSQDRNLSVILPHLRRGGGYRNGGKTLFPGFDCVASG